MNDVFRLRLLFSSVTPEPFFANSDDFSFDDLSGQRLTDLIGIRWGDCPENVFDVVLLKTDGSPYWNRIYLDAGIGFWAQVSKSDALREAGEGVCVDLGRKLDLIKELVGIAVCQENCDLKASQIEVEIGNCIVCLEPFWLEGVEASKVSKKRER